MSASFVFCFGGVIIRRTGWLLFVGGYGYQEREHPMLFHPKYISDEGHSDVGVLLTFVKTPKYS